MEVTLDNPVSLQELIRMAIRLRQELYNYEDRLGSSRDFTELKNSADALIVAILEPVEFRLSSSSSNKAARMYEFPRKKGSVIPISLH